MSSAHPVVNMPYDATTLFTNTPSCTTFTPSTPTSSTVPSVTKTRTSIPKRATRGIRSAWFTFSDWLMDWTPLCLVVSYFFVCTSIFVMCSTEAITVFYYFYMVANLYIAIVAVIESFLGLSPVRKAAAVAEKAQAGTFPTKSDDDLPTMNMVMVAYLPNEKDIVMGQLMYALEELVYPKEKLQITLVYNTPMSIEPIESQLHALAAECDQLTVIKVPNSTSKADNLNHFFCLDSKQADFTGIFDTDHCPHPHNVRWAAESFLKEKPDIVQGRCIVYNTNESFLARLIAIEFDKIYAIAHPGRSRMFEFGLFCGSNGWWRTDVICNLKMHGHMLTEDIDSALRAYGEGRRAVHDMNVISYEMAPNTFGAFWKQRMRWTQGWTQASIRHLPLIWNNPPTGKRSFIERVGIFSLLVTREMSFYLVSQHTCLLLSFVITNWPHDGRGLARLVFFEYPMAEWFLFTTLGCLAATIFFTERVRSEFTSWRSMIWFSVLYVPYLILQSIMGLYGHARELVKYSSWNPTARD